MNDIKIPRFWVSSEKLSFRFLGYLWMLVILIGVDKLGILWFSRMIPWIWVVGWLMILWQFGMSGVFLLKSWKKNLASILFLFILIGLVMFSVLSPSHYSYETAWETDCGLEVLTRERLWDQDCYFGYPATQFLVTSLPSLILGRSLVSLKLGGGLVLIMSLVIFWSGLLKFFSEKSSEVSLLAAGIFLSFFYFNHWGSVMEQSILPFCYMLIFLGTVMRSYKNNLRARLPLWFFVGFLGFFTYPTALALSGLLLVGYVWARKKKVIDTQIQIDYLVVFGLVVGVIVLSGRNDLRVGTSNQNLLTQNWIDEIGELFTKQDGALINPVLAFGFLGFLIYALIQKKNQLVRFLGVWWWGVLVASVFLPGVGGYSLYFKMHRVLVGLPVLVVMGGVLVRELKIGFVRWVIIILILLNGLWARYGFETTRQIQNDVAVVHAIKAVEVREIDTIAFTPMFQSGLITLNRSMEYFYPEAQVIQIGGECGQLEDADFVKKKIILLSQPGFVEQCEDMALERIGMIEFGDQKKAEVWQTK